MHPVASFAAFAAFACVVSCSDDATSLSRSGTRSGAGTSSGVSSGAPSTSSGGSSSGAGSSGTGSAAEICVATINDFRLSLGLAPYARWTETESCADGEATTDASTNRPHGAFGKCQEFGQNECPGRPGPAEKMIPECLKDMWGEGPGGGHYEQMASKKYTKVACGFGTAANGEIWALQNFR